jgi:hypothetical protein
MMIVIKKTFDGAFFFVEKFFSTLFKITIEKKSQSLALDDLRCCQMNERRMGYFSVSFFLSCSSSFSILGLPS